MLGRGLAAAAVVAALDQISKGLVLASFGDSPRRAVAPITSFFDLVLTRNTGVSFGLFNRTGISAAIFSLAAVMIVVILLVWLKRVHSSFLAIAIGLIIGGAIGNVFDRLRFGGVVDFLYFHLPVAACSGGHGSLFDGCWPAFNIADSAICIGVAMMLLDGMLRGPASPAKGREDLSP